MTAYHQTTAPKGLRNSTFVNCLALILLTLVCLNATAETINYRVEVLIFENLDNAERIPELGLPDPGPRDLEAAWPMQGPGAAYPPVDEKLLKLRNHRLQMNRSGRYRSLIHQAWVQPISGKSPLLSFQIPASGAARLGPPRLEGTLQLSKGRYLHAAFDMLLRERDLERDPEPQDLSQPLYQVFQMRQKRRMRSEELHYMDSSRLGVMIIIDPYEPEKELTEEQPPVETSDAAAGETTEQSNPQ